VKFQVSLLSRLGGWVVGWLGGWGEIEIKANSAQLELEFGLSLAKMGLHLSKLMLFFVLL
jgi:hypothetical protein